MSLNRPCQMGPASACNRRCVAGRCARARQRAPRRRGAAPLPAGGAPRPAPPARSAAGAGSDLIRNDVNTGIPPGGDLQVPRAGGLQVERPGTSAGCSATRPLLSTARPRAARTPCASARRRPAGCLQSPRRSPGTGSPCSRVSGAARARAVFLRPLQRPGRAGARACAAAGRARTPGLARSEFIPSPAARATPNRPRLLERRL
jgi:hypothetical protein